MELRENQCLLIIHDEVNLSFKNLNPGTRRKLCNAVKFEVPGARFQPSVKMGRWDGKKSFCSVGGDTFLNLLDILLPIVDGDGYEIILDDRRHDFQINFNEITDNVFNGKVWPLGHPVAGQPILLRDYQVNAIKLYTENRQSMQSLSVGSGKTITCAGMSYVVESAEIYRDGEKIEKPRSLIIVPTKDLVNQTLVDYENVGLDVGVFFGDRKDLGRQHTIVTWQSLNNLMKMGVVDDINVIDTFLTDVVCVIVDEAHSAKSDALQALLSGPFKHVPLRWGMTGTIPEYELQSIAVKAMIGEVVNEITTKELQDLDILSKCNINILQVQDTGEYKSYPDEVTYLLTNKTRMKKIASMIEDIAKSGNTLVVFDRIACGKMLVELIPDSTFISGTNKSKERVAEYKRINDEDHAIVLASSGIVSTGINIPRIFNLVIIEPGKSFIKVIQTVGRGVRKAADKDHVEVWDITSSLKYSKRHLTKRKAFYKIKEFPHKVTKVIL
jgi:superfamily II DNA or RNA helicase